MSLDTLKEGAARRVRTNLNRAERLRYEAKVREALPDIVDALEAADDLRSEIIAADRWCDLPRGECFCAMNRYDQARARMEER